MEIQKILRIRKSFKKIRKFLKILVLLKVDVTNCYKFLQTVLISYQT
jgi:hypothetical protein